MIQNPNITRYLSTLFSLVHLNILLPFTGTHNRFNIQKSQICMVGDRLDTDILFGQNGGCKTLLVLSGKPKCKSLLISAAHLIWFSVHNQLVSTVFAGVTSLSTLQDPKNKIQPDFYTNKISDFLSLNAATV